MKKKHLSLLPIIVLIFTASSAQVSHAVTRLEVEKLMSSLIHGKERNLPNITPVQLPNMRETGERSQGQSIVLEQEVLENDPYSYELPLSLDGEAEEDIDELVITKNPTQNLTRKEVFLTCLIKMGWSSTLTLLKQLPMLEEYASFSPVDFIRTNITPAPPTNLFAPSDEIFPEGDVPKLKMWAKKCVKDVRLETKFIVNGNSLCLIKRGVPTPSGYVQDMKAKNVPLFIVYYIHNKKKNMAVVVPAEQLGLDKLTLSRIATETEGAEFAINGGYFGVNGGQIIGCLRFRGQNMKEEFWCHRSGIAWNNNGEHIFFDGRFTQTVVNDRAFDKYSEVFQAGPMLVSNGRILKNTEDFKPSILSKRQPRTFVAEQPDGTLVWGVVDGRSAAHSVGMTIAELRSFCKERNFVNALNLDGGGSSSIWWNGLNFSKPCNPLGAERKIPYAIVIFREDAVAVCEPIKITPEPKEPIN